MSVQLQQFLEDETIPADSQTVRETWRYANRDGGPDLRFKDNRKLPVMFYYTLTFTFDPSGSPYTLDLLVSSEARAKEAHRAFVEACTPPAPPPPDTTPAQS